MACDAIGAYSGVRQEFAEFALRHDPDGSCQNFRVGSDSPGPVHDSEILARFVFCPVHVAKTDGVHGEIDESLFADAMSIGCSVIRLIDPVGKVTEHVHTRGEAIAQDIRAGSSERPPQPDRCYLGAVKLAAGDVRAIRVDEVENRVRVYDTSHGPSDPLHGDIIANAKVVDKAATKTTKKRLRVALYLLAVRSGLVVAPQYAGSYDLANCGLQILPASE